MNETYEPPTITEVDRTRKVWTVKVPVHDEWAIGPCEVMIEQFGDGPVTVAFRRDNNFTGNRGVWGRPYRAQAVAP